MGFQLQGKYNDINLTVYNDKHKTGHSERDAKGRTETWEEE